MQNGEGEHGCCICGSIVARVGGGGFVEHVQQGRKAEGDDKSK